MERRKMPFPGRCGRLHQIAGAVGGMRSWRRIVDEVEIGGVEDAILVQIIEAVAPYPPDPACEIGVVHAKADRVSDLVLQRIERVVDTRSGRTGCPVLPGFPDPDV